MKKVKDRKPLANIIIEYRNYRTGGEAKEDSPNSDRNDTHVDFRIITVMTEEIGSVRGCSIYHARIGVDFDPTKHPRVWVVTVIYKDGDTFGKSYGNGQIVGVYDTVEKATKIEKQIYEGKYEGYASWDGYFSVLEIVRVENFAIINQ